MTTNVRNTGIGPLLRQWRMARRMSQLDLSLEAEVSSRHLSYLESGKARPSAEMVTRVADALGIPLRERNAMLLAAGYAPIYRETGLTHPEMILARRAVDFILKQQEPYPAIVLDRHWNLIQANQGAACLMRLFFGDLPSERNVIRQIFSQDLFRPYIINWQDTARDLIHRLHQEVAWVPTDEGLRQLLVEVLAYPDVPTQWRTRDLTATLSPILNFVLRKGEIELRFFSTWTTFGTPYDVTLEELRIESSFPADEATATLWHEIVGGNA